MHSKLDDSVSTETTFDVRPAAVYRWDAPATFSFEIKAERR